MVDIPFSTGFDNYTFLHFQPRHCVKVDGDVFNGAKATTEVPLSARYGESTGVIERGMNKERRTGTWEALHIPPGSTRW